MLSFDGGGVHALSYLPIIVNLEEYMGRTVAASRVFQMLVGTSTGSIVATALKVGCRAQDVIELYLGGAPTIFTPEQPWNQLFQKYSTNSLNGVLKAFFDKRFSFQPTWEQLSKHTQCQNGVEL